MLTYEQANTFTKYATCKYTQKHYVRNKNEIAERTDGEHRLALTVDSGTVAKVASLILFYHLSNATVSENVTSMDKAIEHLCSLFYEVRLIWVVI